MATTPVYDRILKDLHEGGELTDLQEKIVKILTDSEGENVTRRDLIYKIYGRSILSADLGNSSEDRKIREAIKSLRAKGATMIVSTSGAAGYCIDNSTERAEEMAGEMEKRARELSQLAARIRAALVAVPVSTEIIQRMNPLHVQPQQVGMFD